MEQASNTGCRDEEFSSLKSWTDESILDSSLKISSYYFSFKKDLFTNDNCFKFPLFVEDYLKQICLPEIFADSFCKLSDEKDLIPFAPVLEAFQTYAVSLYDQISDNHLLINGKPSVLGTYGISSTELIKNISENLYKSMGKNLEKFVPNAQKIADQQYSLTLSSDKIRNNGKILSPLEAINLQDNLAGIPTKNIALLCGGDNEIQNLGIYFGNLISTLDDLGDLINLSDFKEKKTTIPLSYLFNENSKIFEHSPEKSREIFFNSDAFKKTLDYLENNLNKSDEILKKRDPFEKNILTEYLRKINKHLEKLRNNGRI